MVGTRACFLSVAVALVAGSVVTRAAAPSLRGMPAGAARVETAHGDGASGVYHPPFDHQTKAYSSQFEPASTTSTVTVTPFFSPDHSVDTIINAIESVQQGGTIDIGTPGFSSWSGCTQHDAGCVGCTIANMANEEFPVFPALLNAVHQKGAKVRIVTNNYDTPTCAGQVAPLDFLSLNGIEIRYYSTTTFYHAKYMQVDGPSGTTSVSSINYSYTSFLENREAGILLKAGAEALTSFLAKVFDFDFGAGVAYHVNQTYTAAQMAQITSSSKYAVQVPSGPDYPGSYVTPVPQDVTAEMQVEAVVSPDFALKAVSDDLTAATETFELFIYQVTDTGLCQDLVSAHNRGVNVTLLISSDIYSSFDKEAAQTCYESLQSAGLKVQATPSYYKYSHQKYWITDGKRVGLSTGNWSPTDLPAQSSFPVYPAADWVDANRDAHIKVTHPAVVAVYHDTLLQDYMRGSAWTPWQ